MKEYEVANFHGQASDAYAYVSYMPTLERLKSVGGSEFFFPGRKMVHSAAFWM